jgi:hypothetical protein
MPEFQLEVLVSRDSYSRHFYGTLVRQEQLVSPPPRLIPQVINKLKRKTCTGTLVVPEWTSAPFWPMIVDGQSNFRSYPWTPKPRVEILAFCIIVVCKTVGIMRTS